MEHKFRFFFLRVSIRNGYEKEKEKKLVRERTKKKDET